MYDCLVIGGGPAGLSAAVYMGRFLRRTLVLDAGEGRSSFEQVNENYLGFPRGIKVRELRELGRAQAARFGVEFVDCRVTSLQRDASGFTAATDAGTFAGRTTILCTGVCDIWPPLPDVDEYVGRTLFWCITCDGFRTLGKRVVLFGRDDEAATTACQFQLYTRNITFVVEPGKMSCSEEKRVAMDTHGIRITEGVPVSVSGTPDRVEAVVLSTGERVPADLMFSLLGCVPNNALARDVGADITADGYVRVDQEGYTSVPGLFAAGDLSKMHTHQVVSAAHEGAEAAQTANYYLYAGYQRE